MNEQIGNERVIPSSWPGQRGGGGGGRGEGLLLGGEQLVVVVACLRLPFGGARLQRALLRRSTLAPLQRALLADAGAGGPITVGGGKSWHACLRDTQTVARRTDRAESSTPRQGASNHP